MDSFFARYKNPLTLVAILLAQTIGLAVQVRRTDENRDGHHVRLVRLWAATIAWPLEALVHSVGHDFSSAWSNYIDLRNVRNQNRELHARVGELQQEEVRLAEDAEQGHRLQALLKFQQQYVAKTVAAQVIGTSGADQSPALTIDKGSADGVEAGMAVITPDGVVGRVRDVFPHEAQVIELNDPTSGAGVVLESSRIRAILRGTPTGKMQINNLTEDSRVKPGEHVLTSGGDQVYPRGLNVGTIESIRPDPDHQPYTAIVVKPAAKLDELEEVLVVTATQANMPAQMQQDLNAAADAAQTTGSAEQLPDINNPGGAPGATGPQAPKVLPTLHPDRYSSGVTPPASTLTPGGSNAPNGVTTPTPRPQPETTGPAESQPAGTDGGQPQQ